MRGEGTDHGVCEGYRAGPLGQDTRSRTPGQAGPESRLAWEVGSCSVGTRLWWMEAAERNSEAPEAMGLEGVVASLGAWWGPWEGRAPELGQAVRTEPGAFTSRAGPPEEDRASQASALACYTCPSLLCSALLCSGVRLSKQASAGPPCSRRAGLVCDVSGHAAWGSLHPAGQGRQLSLSTELGPGP